MKVLLLGASGMLGKEVLRQLEANYAIVEKIYSPSSHQLDISCLKNVEDYLTETKPNVVINCAGIVKGSNVNEYMMSVNAVGPINLCSACHTIGARLIHISTDCVYSGKDGPYTEMARPDPIDYYGVSKQLGEIVCEPHLTIRTSFIGYGKYGLLRWAFAQTGTIQGYVDSLWNGLTSLQLAKAIVTVGLGTKLHGLLHIGTRAVISKAYLLEIIKIIFDLEYTIERVNAPIDSNMGGNKTLLSNRLFMPLPSIEEMLYDLKHFGIKS